MKTVRALLGLALAAALALPAQAAPAPQSRWIGAWTAGLMSDPKGALPEGSDDVTLRQVVRVTAGGPRIRLRLTNAFGASPLVVDSVRVGLAGERASAQVLPDSNKAVTFGGRAQVIVPAGASYLSDPIVLPVKPLTRLAVSFHLPNRPSESTLHWVANTTGWLAKGDCTADADLAGAQKIDHWHNLGGVEVETSARAAVVLAFGDSITDGHGATPNQDDRWTDVLAQRLQADPRTRHIAVLNTGISGNRLLSSGSNPGGLSRLDRDVFSQPGVKTIILLLGINDIGALSREPGPITPEKRQAVVEGLAAGYTQVIQRAHAKGIKVAGATLLPFSGNKYYRSDAEADADRQAVNRWIRTSGAFDAVIDFDQITRDPARPLNMRAEYDSGDLLHPGPGGYRAMGAAIPLDLLLKLTR